MRDIGWFKEGVRYQEPDGSEETSHENEAVECCDYICFNSAMLPTPCHSVTIIIYRGMN